MLLQVHVDAGQSLRCLPVLHQLLMPYPLTVRTEKGEKNIERTPCMAEGITEYIWTWKEFLMIKVGVNH